MQLNEYHKDTNETKIIKIYKVNVDIAHMICSWRNLMRKVYISSSLEDTHVRASFSQEIKRCMRQAKTQVDLSF